MDAGLPLWRVVDDGKAVGLDGIGLPATAAAIALSDALERMGVREEDLA